MDHATDREDLFQEIAVALWQALPRFRGDCTERTYVYRVAHNTALSFATSRQRRVTREQPRYENDSDQTDVANPERDAIHNQKRQMLWRAVQELPITDRQIVLLHLEGLSATEIEAATGFTAGKVAMRLSRVRKRLAEQLNQTQSEQHRTERDR
jgi:RNA polymerase sigma-70 factor (ECF subfamily)